jgi:hypothetical protein
MTKLTANDKIKRWAVADKSRNIAHAIKETGQTEKAFMYMLGRLKRHGIIDYTRIGQQVQLECVDYNTIIAYI